jgi:hypothetical protein
MKSVTELLSLRRPARLAAILSIALVQCLAAHCQVFELSAGDSSLYQAAGGSLALHAPSYDAVVGGGMIAGRMHYGAAISKTVKSTTYSLGDGKIDFLLPTDVFDSSHYLYGRGLGIDTKLDSATIIGFAGTVSTLYETPVFEGASSSAKFGFFSLHDDLSARWKIYFDMIISDKISEIEAIRWKPTHGLELSAAAGLGADQPYAAGSLRLNKKWLDVTASYVSAGENFRRVVVSSPLQAEPVRGNVLVSLKPAHFLTLVGGTQSYLVPDSSTGRSERSTVRSASTYLQIAGGLFSATGYDSSSQGVTSHAASFTASRDITTRVKVTANYLISKPKGNVTAPSLFATVAEKLNEHVSINESLSSSDGQTSFLYGGSLLSNLLTFSANYETFYVPTRPSAPFQESLLLDVSLHLFGVASLHGNTFVGPTGHLLYTTEATGLISHTESDAKGSQLSLPGSLLRGLVVDQDDRPVEGAALMIDSRAVFTDSSGRFVVRESKPRQHKLSVNTDGFLNGGEWKITSMPTTIRSSTQQNAPETVVIVHRLRPNAVPTAAPSLEQKSPAPAPQN